LFNCTESIEPPLKTPFDGRPAFAVSGVYVACALDATEEMRMRAKAANTLDANLEMKTDFMEDVLPFS
jgi:hypothetical protein